MLMIRIEDTKLLMKKLLFEGETAFDAFLLSEAIIKMGQTFTIDGHINRDFYTDEDIEELKEEAVARNQVFDERMVRWAGVKSHALSIIKGRKTPLSFSIIFYLSRENTDRFISRLSLSDNAILPDGLMLHLKYVDGILYASTGTSYPGFSLDKTIDKAWDDMVLKFFTSLEIAFEELS